MRFKLRGVFRDKGLVNNDFEFHDFQPPIIAQRFLQMRNDDLACQERMVVRYVCLRVSRSVLKLNFKPIPKTPGADPDVRRAYRRLNGLASSTLSATFLGPAQFLIPNSLHTLCTSSFVTYSGSFISLP